MPDRPIYTIRLRGPWQLEPVVRFLRQADGTFRESFDHLPPATRAKMPADWSESCGHDFLGRVRYRRTFQSPTGLDEGQRVWLVVEPPRSRGVVSLNAESLGHVSSGDMPGRYDVTERLRESNQLEIVVEHPPLDSAEAPNDDSTTHSPGGLVGEVRLEIEE